MLSPANLFKSEQRTLYHRYGINRLIHRHVNAIHLFRFGPVLSGVFFRPEENRLLSEGLNDVWI
jgi:hypothetical protein